MQQVQGVIDSIHTKQVTTKYGDKNVYIATINGNEVNLGFKTSLSQGENVVLDVEHKYGSLQLIQPLKNGATAAPSTVANGSTQSTVAVPHGTATPPPFPLKPNAKDISIIRQSSLNRAVDVVAALTLQDLLSVNTEQEYLDKIFEIALQFTDFGSGQREQKMADAMASYGEGEE